MLRQSFVVDRGCKSKVLGGLSCIEQDTSPGATVGRLADAEFWVK